MLDILKYGCDPFKPREYGLDSIKSMISLSDEYSPSFIGEKDDQNLKFYKIVKFWAITQKPGFSEFSFEELKYMNRKEAELLSQMMNQSSKRETQFNSMFDCYECGDDIEMKDAEIEPQNALLSTSARVINPEIKRKTLEEIFEYGGLSHRSSISSPLLDNFNISAAFSNVDSGYHLLKSSYDSENLLKIKREGVNEVKKLNLNVSGASSRRYSLDEKLVVVEVVSENKIFSKFKLNVTPKCKISVRNLQVFETFV